MQLINVLEYFAVKENVLIFISQGGTVVQWLALLPYSEKVQGSNLSSSLITVHALQALLFPPAV